MRGEDGCVEIIIKALPLFSKGQAQRGFPLAPAVTVGAFPFMTNRSERWNLIY